ncbi:hypothetical protein [Marilutibacter aestuarii]|uniref:Uncharacterized protein n=1 Tax=Marilutibacter aestuarii TaxID=1706195 RepID=A0A508ATA3_9GAMM|nr:hypothetical protein [Lysobacter aestuarii]TQD51721.1 hypothetical protein FKV25_00145 [Lysobacter aestuarii]
MPSAHTTLPRLGGGLLALCLAACQAPAGSPPAAVRDGDAARDAAGGSPPADAFFARVSALCGQAFAGRVVVDVPTPAGDDPFAGKPLVMHVRDCSADELRIPFHVGADRSRTWVLGRTATGLRLHHDHRHEDGSEDVLTMYGGHTLEPGTPGRQVFPADTGSKALFTREGRAVSNANAWAMEIEPGTMFAYALTRPGREFRVEFDLGTPVDVPPPAWGHDATR